MFDDRRDPLLASAVATWRDRRHAFAVTAVLVVAFVATIPVAAWRVPALPQFVPMYDTAILVLDTLAAVLLYAQFEHVRRRSLLALACAYVFTPLVVAGHALSVPNAIVPGTVIGGEQTAAWLWIAWHGLFPLFIGAYAVMAPGGPLNIAVPEEKVRRTGTIAVAGTMALALAVVAGVALGDPVMPALMRGDVQSSRLTALALGLTCLVHLAALGALVWYTRLQRLIDTWLAVSLVALAIDALLSAVLIEARNQLGFYLGRVYGLLGVLFVLGVLLRETVMLSAMAAHLLHLERAARLEAESAGRAKDEFLAMLGHELRNPLSPIATAVELMRLRGVESPELPVIDRQVRYLTRLVDDLLDVSRITKGKITLRKGYLEVSEAVLQAVEIASPALEQKSQHLDIRVDRTGLTVQADRARLAQVVANLLTNASKYSDNGTRISIRGERVHDRVRLHIEDEGLGIAPEMLDRIFEPFTQQNETLARSHGGLGLGLTIVRSLVHLHGGTVEARSDGPGRGSEFIVELPFAEAPSDTRPHVPHEGERRALPAPARILVVDDNVDAAAALSALLTELGHVVAMAHDAPAAIALAKTFRPEIALLDIGLPVMDGYELARRLRGDSNAGGAAMYLVALTGYGSERDRRRAMDAGFDEHVVKPVEVAELEKVIMRFQARRRSSELGPTETARVVAMRRGFS